jgi:ABC-type branched-subunit amino acid transport system substrate-binding protein
VQYTIGTADFAGPVQQVLAANPDGIIVTGAAVDVGKAMIAIKRAQFAGPVVDTIAGGDPLVVKYGEASAEGIYGQSLVDTSGAVAGWQEYVSNVKSIPDADPKNTFTLSGYIAAKALVAAIKSIKGEVTPGSVQKALESLSNVDMGGLTGAISFTPTNHLGLTKVQLTQVKNGVVTPTGTTLEVR